MFSVRSLMEDLRYAVRLLFRQPGFTLAAVLLLALGIGVNSAIFSIVDSVLIHPLSYSQPERLYTVWTKNLRRNTPQGAFSPPEFQEYARRQQGFSHFAAYMHYPVTLTGQGEPARVLTRLVSAGYLEMLGISPFIGRGFAAEEYQLGRNQVALLTESFWKERFGGDPGIVGKVLRLDNELHVVAGILPHIKGESRAVDMYLPLSLSPEAASSWDSRFLYVTGRLRDGVSGEQASSELRSLGAAIAAEHPETNAGTEPFLISAEREAQGDARQPLLVIMAAVGLVLLVTCSNVANLLLVRSSARHKEIAIRSAMGAPQTRVFRQMITESLVLAWMGGAVGLLVAWASVGAIGRWGATTMPMLAQARVDWLVVGYTFLVSALAGVLFGAIPAWQVLRLNLADTLRDESRGSSGGAKKGTTRSILVVSEVALSVILLVGAGLLLRTFIELSRIDLGFKADNVLTLRTTLAESAYSTDGAKASYVRRVTERLERVPGVVSVGVTSALPLMGVNWLADFTVDGRPAQAGQKASATYSAITPRYLETIGARLVAGRMIAETDNEQAPPVVLVSEALAKRDFPGEEPIGKFINLRVGRFKTHAQIVGVVRHVACLKPDEKPRPVIYQPHAQRAWPFLAFAVRTAGDPMSMEGAVRRAFFEVDAELPVERVQPLSALMDRVLAQQRLALILLMIFSGLAVVLAAVGLFGVLAVAVSQRSREMGIRMALGASGHDILRLVLSQGMGLTVAGIIAGLLAAPLASQVMRQMLYGVQPLDPITFAAVALVVLAASVAACVMPAWRASKVDPGLALRRE
ncbi:ABC transporter permease [uncultured Paludibaculum sp.]|uniref:ABC transporter permease n=1 Tax=uncultured Paludibaculum sp. TaxID=1765020 RepID=UPI002AAA9828|nr:ABC transporter permease [uncultured Paludibaculum sp.]